VKNTKTGDEHDILEPGSVETVFVEDQEELDPEKRFPEEHRLRQRQDEWQHSPSLAENVVEGFRSDVTGFSPDVPSALLGSFIVSWFFLDLDHPAFVVQLENHRRVLRSKNDLVRHLDRRH